MQVLLGSLFLPEWAGTPRQMSVGDYEIWKRWLVLHRDEYSGFYYDVEIVGDEELPVDTPDNLRRMWARSTSKRIDAVAVQLSRLVLIEVRVNAGASAFGALANYMRLWQAAPPNPLPVSGLIITDNADPTLAALAADYGFTVEII